MNAYEAAWKEGISFSRFLAEAESYADLWGAVAARTRADPGVVARLDASGGCWRLLTLVDDWCGDGIDTISMAAALADASSVLELRIVPRDRFSEVRDRHLTKGSQSIPIVILLDREGRPHGHWGPRPAPLQAEFERRLRDMAPKDRFREVRRWHAKDRGASTAHEIAGLVEKAAADSASEPLQGVGGGGRQRAWSAR
jgi:hypothetical protein